MFPIPVKNSLVIRLLAACLVMSCKQTNRAKNDIKENDFSEMKKLSFDSMAPDSYNKYYFTLSDSIQVALFVNDSLPNVLFYKVDVFDLIKNQRDSVKGSATLISDNVELKIYDTDLYTAKQYKSSDSCSVFIFITKERSNKYLKMKCDENCGIYSYLASDYTFIRFYDAK